MRNLIEKIRGTTTISSFVALFIMLFVTIGFKWLFNISGGLVNGLLILFITSIAMFLLFKIYLVFLSETDYSKKAVKLVDRYDELKRVQGSDEKFLTINERNVIFNAECQQENSKHLKAVIREVAILVALAWLLSQMFTFGVVEVGGGF